MDEKILVVDDQQDICEILEFNLASEGYRIVCAWSAEEALERISPDCSLILLDVMMGGMSGYKLAERLRRDGNDVPIIFLTAKDAENDMLTGFSVGGDDYIAKPFSVKEVVARVKAVIKRHAAAAVQPDAGAGRKMIFNELTIDPELKEVLVGGVRIAITKTEFEILTLLASNPSRIFRREEIIDRLWKDSPYITERTIDVHITRLRKKLGEYAGHISSRSGYGYRFSVPHEV